MCLMGQRIGWFHTGDQIDGLGIFNFDACPYRYRFQQQHQQQFNTRIN